MGKVKKVGKISLRNGFSEEKKGYDGRKKTAQDDIFDGLLHAEMAKLRKTSS